jgi:hypothetical protein
MTVSRVWFYLVSTCVTFRGSFGFSLLMVSSALSLIFKLINTSIDCPPYRHGIFLGVYSDMQFGLPSDTCEYMRLVHLATIPFCCLSD